MMEGGLNRHKSAFGKDSTISKVSLVRLAPPCSVVSHFHAVYLMSWSSLCTQRKKIAILAAIVIVVAASVTGLAVGVSQKNKHHSVKATKPGESPAPSNPTSSGRCRLLSRPPSMHTHQNIALLVSCGAQW